MDGYPEFIDLAPPPEWLTADGGGGFVLTPVESHRETLPEMHLAAVTLNDGSIIVALVYPGGKRYARVSPYTGWALEERPVGDPPAEEDRTVVDTVWRDVLPTLVDVGRFSRLVTTLFAEAAEDDDLTNDEDEDEGDT